MYPGITEWEETPLATSLLCAGVILSSPLMPVIERGAEKLMRWIGDKLNCCARESKESLLADYPIEDTSSLNSPKDSGKNNYPFLSKISAILWTFNSCY